MKNRVIPTLSAAKGRNLALFLGPSEIPPLRCAQGRNDGHFQSSEGSQVESEGAGAFWLSNCARAWFKRERTWERSLARVM